MAIDARATRPRAGLRRSLPLVFGLPLLALVISAMYWHSVLASALTPTRSSATIVAVAPVTDGDPAFAEEASGFAGVTDSTDQDLQRTVEGPARAATDGHPAGIPDAKTFPGGAWPAVSGPRAPPRQAV